MKVNREDLEGALLQKANKQSLIDALHRKANKADIQVIDEKLSILSYQLGEMHAA